MRVETLLPFMEAEDLKELADQILSGEVKGVNIVTLFPFLNTEDFDELVDKLIEKGNSKALYGALPFLSSAQVDKVYEMIQEGKLEGFREEALIPFLGSKKIKNIFTELIKKATESADRTVEQSEKIAEKVQEKVDKVLSKLGKDEE